MKNITILSCFFFLYISCSTSPKPQEYSNDSMLQLEIDTLISGIVAENILNDEGIGISWRKNPQWERFIRLSAIATEEDLIKLMDHSNAVVRGYSFHALAKMKSSQVFPILKKHLSDTTTVTTFSGCFLNDEMLGDYLIDVVSPNQIDSNIYRLNVKEQAVVDSILLFDKSIKLYARTSLLLDIDTDDRYYNRIREIAIEDNEKFALPVLAKYKRKADKRLIIDKLTSKERDDWYYALMAVRNYPDPDFFPYVVKLHHFEMTDKKGLTIPGIRMLYQAIVQYKDKTSRGLIQKTLSAKRRADLTNHYEYIYLALSKYPHNIYNGLKEQIQLTDYQLSNMEYSMEDDT